MKTLEQLADEYVQAWWGSRNDNMTLATRQAFCAGYSAASAIYMEKTEQLSEWIRLLEMRINSQLIDE